MSKSNRPVIRLRGVRHNNLKNFDLDLPLRELIVVTGLSGSGKSSLAFDTLFAEGQRRYIETFSPYARQFFDRMDKPRVDRIEGIPPTIAIEQRNSVKTTRSTVGTITEVCDYMKVLWPMIARLHCRRCGRSVRKDSPDGLWRAARTSEGGLSGSELLITFDLPLSDKLSLEESLALVGKQGYQRLLLDGRIVRLEVARATIDALSSRPALLTVVQDRVTPVDGSRPRFVEACEQAYHFGKGKLSIHTLTGSGPGSEVRIQTTLPFSSRLHCASCDIEYPEPTPALFSFNHPAGACPACRGFGRVISIDYSLAMPDLTRTLAEGVVKPWQTGHGVECQRDLLRVCRQFGIPTDVRFERLSKKWRRFVIEGDPDYGRDGEHEWPRVWYGVKGYFRWLESKAYKMHVRVMLSRYRAYSPCADCGGTRFRPEALLYRFTIGDLRSTPPASSSTIDNRQSSMTLAGFYALPVRDALSVIDTVAKAGGEATEARFLPHDPLSLVLSEVRSRLACLNDIGLGYLTLDRPTRSLSGGETERVSLTQCLGSGLVNTLFVLDEPSVGLHPRDTEKLVQILEHLRDAGNTVVVVEHEAGVMRAADQIIDLGPGHGASGGRVVFQGDYAGILKSKASLTGQYLSGRRRIEIPERRRVGLAGATRGWACPALRISGVTRHNLKEVAVDIPLGRFVCVTGVSGSGKTTLVREVLLPALEARLRSPGTAINLPALKASERSGDGRDEDSPGGGVPAPAVLSGWERVGRVVLVDQSLLGKTPRSNPAVYIGAFDDIREWFAQSEPARRRGLNASAFSFNSAHGQCERCRGAGFEKIEMQFLSDVFIRCPDCGGRRYRKHILDVRIRVDGNGAGAARREWSIADMLDATVDEAVGVLDACPDSRPARRAVGSLRLLQEVGLGYLRLGQPVNTLSGGESQRLKLVRHLADAAAAVSAPEDRLRSHEGGRDQSVPTLFLFDEPTTGLHFDDVRVLLGVFQRLVAAGQSVLVIEHNLDVIRSADWVIDLGPGAGDEGGRVVAQGTPEDVAASEESHTGRFLEGLGVLRRGGKSGSGPARASGASDHLSSHMRQKVVLVSAARARRRPGRGATARKDG
jgi:excinuclease ABC subunit A